MKYTILDSDKPVPIPPEIAVCPMCGGKLTVEMDEWQEDEHGLWKASNPHSTCEHEPDIDSAEWEEWHSWHYAMPYVDWLPVEQKIDEWLEQTYRFKL